MTPLVDFIYSLELKGETRTTYSFVHSFLDKAAMRPNKFRVILVCDHEFSAETMKKEITPLYLAIVDYPFVNDQLIKIEPFVNGYFLLYNHVNTLKEAEFLINDILKIFPNISNVTERVKVL